MSPSEEIKSRLDIVDVIGEYIQLKQAGVNHKARCPFHDEKTASLMVSKPKQIWHCFGCGEGGDIFGFVMKHEGLEFPDALRLLAAKAGVTVKSESPEKRTEREMVGRALAESVKFWEEVLWKSDEAKEARRYLQDERHILPEQVRAWHLGFAPDSWDGAISHLSKLGISEEDMIKAGVAVRKMAVGGRSVYDRFRNRIIFPFTNPQGQVVGVTSRAMPGNDTEGKYVNTPDTILYHKGEILYGLDKAKTDIRKQDLAIIVEGNVDVISSNQCGITNVIAASGTALTPDQIRLLKRYTNRIAFAFDADIAGETATMRGLMAALADGLEVFLIRLPKRANGSSFKDPDECIRENPEIWKKVVATPEPLLEYYFRRVTVERDMSRLENKQLAVKILLPILARVPDSVAVSHYLQKLSALVHVSEGDLRDRLKVSRPKETEPTSSKTTTAKAVVRSSWTILSEHLLGALIANPKDLTYAIREITPEMIDPLLTDLYKEFVVFYTKTSGQENVGAIEEALKQHLSGQPEEVTLINMLDILSLLKDKDFADMTSEEVRKDIIGTVKRLKQRYLREVLQKIERSIKEAESIKPVDSEKLKALLNEFQTVSSELIKLEVI